jgi:hypothetical protein
VCILVETYFGTATLSSATVPSGQYANYDGSSSKAICSVDEPNLATQNEDGGQLLLGNKRRMDPRVWIKKKRTKESTAGNESSGIHRLFQEITRLKMNETWEDYSMNGNEYAQDVNKGNLERVNNNNNKLTI